MSSREATGSSWYMSCTSWQGDKSTKIPVKHKYKYTRPVCTCTSWYTSKKLELVPVDSKLLMFEKLWPKILLLKWHEILISESLILIVLQKVNQRIQNQNTDFESVFFANIVWFCEEIVIFSKYDAKLTSQTFELVFDPVLIYKLRFWDKFKHKYRLKFELVLVLTCTCTRNRPGKNSPNRTPF